MEESSHFKALDLWADSFIGSANTNTNTNELVIVEVDRSAPLGPEDHKGLDIVTNLMALWLVPRQDTKAQNVN
ncbi:MAG: hypothetical protein ACKVG1_04560 [Rhodospirillales bacterium]|jgi:hypothetical protein|tara:strand:- start:388 stop:606 length:219 start_codon:yes stop_codon:yes gene_type:complete